jgi:PleD family two-component response regulator
MPIFDSKILLIDDDPIIVQILVDTLDEYQNVLSANSAAAGLKIAREFRPDLIILDVLMPGFGGWDCCSIIRGDPQLSDTPVIFLTGKQTMDAVIESFKAGGSDFLTKPINETRLLECVARQLDLRQRQKG